MSHDTKTDDEEYASLRLLVAALDLTADDMKAQYYPAFSRGELSFFQLTEVYDKIDRIFAKEN